MTSVSRTNSHYPIDVAESIRTHWLAAGHIERSLPNPHDLRHLVDVAYQASLLREERETVRCRLIACCPSDFIVKNSGPPWMPQILTFEKPQELTPHTIRKLSAAAGYSRSLLAVSLCRDEVMRVWGIVFSGARWNSRVEGGRFEGPPLPSSLVLQVEGPGHLVAACGYSKILESAHGQLVSEGLDPFQSRWLPERFKALRERVLKTISSELHAQESMPLSEGFVKLAAQSVVRRALSLVRTRGHGGCLVYVSEDSAEWGELDKWFRFRARLEVSTDGHRFQELIHRLLRRLIQINREKGCGTIEWND